jgi:hypothetical protein
VPYLNDYSASVSVSSVLILRTESIELTNILPSPILPVLAAFHANSFKINLQTDISMDYDLL